eukprot:CAMPEP_0202906048 /NCGR_PEP_ID=MMETSP1392-20130828/37156_1 /ASSEMBLY_ACC=CAM_ASM_000868 /TAXON_ID=225041 /ORGANISM="Chlamydomonas chlamydogama, Strain SAG 11-48b" /LENGTH=93 /DNA_ID=CAMNT_0049594401 /DNA_START=113 /DNA_END=391 /DNA_ORIENTATION=+
MRQLKRIVDTTGAEIVLSSSWRQFEGARQKLANALTKYGLKFTRWTSTLDLDGSRAGQILAFVEEAGRQLHSWAVLDDEDVTCGRGGMMMEVV